MSCHVLPKGFGLEPPMCVCVFWGVVEDLHFGVAGYQLFPLGNYEEPQRIEAFIMLLFYKEHVELCHT